MPILEFCLPPQDLPRLLRETDIVRRGGRAAASELVWHDTATGDLAAGQLSLCRTKSLWRLERASPQRGELWSPGTPAPLVAEAADLAGLGPLPGPLMPIAGFRGESRSVAVRSEAAATLTFLSGALRGVAQEKPVCRLLLQGSTELLVSLSTQWAASLPIEVPQWSLATEATALARGVAPPPRRTGGPEIVGKMSVADSIEVVVGHLTDVILAGVPAACEGNSEDAVHVMRVAVRRLRSALSVFRRVADGPTFAAMQPQLAALAETLGAARDWDVFLAGTCQDVMAAMPDEPRLQVILALAGKRREAAYAALRQEFGSPAFRQLSVALVQMAALRPWLTEADEEHRAKLAAEAGAFASDSLARQHAKIIDHGADIAALPAEELHALRKRAKRFRYTMEFFAPQFGHRNRNRFLRRIARLQESLGHLNDGAAASGLMHTLRGGPDRQFGIGAVLGFTAARSTESRSAIATSWKKVRAAKPFW